MIIQKTGCICVCVIFLVALNFASKSRGQVKSDSLTVQPDTLRSPLIPDFETITDRWSGIPLPSYELYDEGRWYDPYNQNILKGDYPIFGQNTFFILTAVVDNFGEVTRVRTPSGVSTLDPFSQSFFGRGERFLLNENARVTLELYHGDVAFRPRDWEVKVTTVFNLNYLNTREKNAVNVNVRKGDNRTETHLAFQELSFEKHLFDISDHYDFISLKIGIQRFGSDFRNFVFSDFNLGARLFGNFASNRFQYNVVFFPMLEKETNSELNTVFDDREQDVAIANLYVQDFLTLGYTTELSFHYNHDKATIHFDENGFPVRPAIIGNVKPHEIDAFYLGWAGDGHISDLNINHAFYHVFGKDDFNSLAGQRITLNAQMAALELSLDHDWMRFKVSGFYASGDADPMDDVGKGFDAIIDQPFFAGGPFSYWNSQALRLQGVGLVQKLSLLPSLRSSKLEGQANFVNPGLWLANVGYDAEISPKLKAILNVNYLRFVHTESLQNFLNQPAIHRQIGIDYGIGIIYRPFLNNNAILTFGLSAIYPLKGFRDIYETSQMQFAGFTSMVFTY
ncbi:MAG: hypothetical protein HY707_14580 [Ignavibacteriae bacterium]|nr:hypothetical protein [Ignavibacteriota bacterium]